MFLLRRPSAEQIEGFLHRQRGVEFSYPEIGATRSSPPQRYTVDRNRIALGNGSETFRKAVGVLQAWQMFRLGWVEVFPTNAPIEVGTTVGVLITHFGFWSLNACRIVYVIDEERRYGFAYGTLDDHGERGEERFSVEWALEDDSVSYNILAFSRPRKWQANVAYPLTRVLQKRFARDSMAAMKRAML